MTLTLLLAACSLSTPDAEAPPVTPPPAPVVTAPATEVTLGEKTGKVYGDMAFRAPAEIGAVSFGPGGAWLLAQDYEGGLHQFALPSGEPMAGIQSPCSESYGSAMALSPDGRTIAIACDYDDIAIASVETGVVNLKLAGDVETMKWSSDGNSLAIVNYESVRVLNPRSGKVAWRTQSMSEAQVANRGDVWLVAGYFTSEDGDDESAAVIAVSASSGKVLWKHNEEYNVFAPAMSLDGTRAAFATEEAILIKDARTGEGLRRRVMDAWFDSIAPTATGWWALQEGRMLHFDEDFDSEVITPGSGDQLVSSPDGQIIVATGGTRLSVWNASGEPLHDSSGLPTAAQWVDVSDSGEVFAASTELSLTIVNRETGAAIGVQLDGWTGVMDLSPDGGHFAYSTEESVFVVDSHTGRTTRLGLESDVSFLAFTPDSNEIIAVGGYDELALMRISVDPMKLQSAEQIAAGDADYARLSADGHALAIPGLDGTTRVYEIE